MKHSRSKAGPSFSFQCSGVDREEFKRDWLPFSGLFSRQRPPTPSMLPSQAPQHTHFSEVRCSRQRRQYICAPTVSRAARTRTLTTALAFKFSWRIQACCSQAGPDAVAFQHCRLAAVELRSEKLPDPKRMRVEHLSGSQPSCHQNSPNISHDVGGAQ